MIAMKICLVHYQNNQEKVRNNTKPKQLSINMSLRCTSHILYHTAPMYMKIMKTYYMKTYN